MTNSPQLWLLRSALFLAAFLLFAIQPLVGRLLLPLVGGAAGGWLVVLCFFQLALLAGYALALLLARLPVRAQNSVALVGLVAALFVLQLDFTQAPAPTHEGEIFWLLLRALGPLAVMLACLSPLLQRSSGLSDAKVYRLYIASNAGSLLGLLCYPFLLEPLLGLVTQQQALRGAIGVLALLLGALLFTSAQSQALVEKTKLSLRVQLLWLWYAFLPAALSVALAGLLSAEFGAVPIIWMVPLLLYLLSFIAAFAWPQAARWKKSGVGAGLLLLLAVLALQLSGNQAAFAFALLCASFFAAALYGHGLLASHQPPPAALPRYYLVLALGGALGGLFSTLVAPLLFRVPVEYGLVMAAVLLGTERNLPLRRVSRVLGSLVLIISLCIMVVMSFAPGTKVYRNFYGVSFVTERPEGNGRIMRYLISGSGIQGSEIVLPAPTPEAGFYFSILQPLFAQSTARSVGVVGGGVGIAVCFMAPDRSFTIYEIDPKHRKIAEQEFSYFKLCGAPRWRMGDGRLELQRDTDARYDVLMIDAFQGGQIPMHLLSREALALYQARLSPQGILLYNLNSIYYDFYPQLAAQAQERGWQMWKAPSTWALLAPPDVALDFLRFAGWQPYTPQSMPKAWSDDHANLLGALR